jgi:tetratricopeptide (TPR) repeat protein
VIRAPSIPTLLAAALLLAAPLLLLAGPSSGASLSAADIQQLFQEANHLFRRGNELSRTDPAGAKDSYRAAVIRFERIVDEGGIENGKLFYNIGNAYFRLDDLGRAILNYRRAGQFLSGDANLTQNLRYARSRRIDQIEEKQETQVLKTLLFWHYDLSQQTRSALFAGFFAAFWLLAALRLFFSDRVPAALLAVCGGVALLFLGSLGVESFSGSHDGGVILAEQVVGRKGDGDTYEPSFKEPLHAGTEFALVENRGEWYQVELADGQRCWIPATAAGLIRKTEPQA